MRDSLTYEHNLIQVPSTFSPFLSVFITFMQELERRRRPGPVQETLTYAVPPLEQEHIQVHPSSPLSCPRSWKGGWWRRRRWPPTSPAPFAWRPWWWGRRWGGLLLLLTPAKVISPSCSHPGHTTCLSKWLSRWFFILWSHNSQPPLSTAAAPAQCAGWGWPGWRSRGRERTVELFFVSYISERKNSTFGYNLCYSRSQGTYEIYTPSYYKILPLKLPLVWI